jgi:hypothetical protein
MIATACALSLGMLLVGLRRRQIRWSTAVLLLAFALSILNVAATRADTQPGKSMVRRTASYSIHR